MSALLGPARCQGCGESVYWNGKYWRFRGQHGMRRHACGEPARPVCGARMKCGESCARLPGHGYEHRTQYALDNAARQKRAGFAA